MSGRHSVITSYSIHYTKLYDFGVLLASPALYGLFRWKADFLTRMPPFLVSILAAAGGGTLFWLLRMDTFFLGDGASYLAEHFRWVRGLSISEDVLFSPGSAPLTAWILAKGAVRNNFV